MVRIDRIEIVEFKSISEQFAREEGDGSLENWLGIHTAYYAEQLAKINRKLTLPPSWFASGSARYKI